MTDAVMTIAPETETPEIGVANRRDLAGALRGVLGDSYVLTVKTQGVHWNIVGPLFKPIHDLTEEHYEDLFQAVDDLAERIRSLGQVAPMSFAEMAAEASLAEEREAKTAKAMVEGLIADHEALSRRFREVAEIAANNRDGATEDLMNARMAFHDKAAWMLRATAAD